MSTSNFPSSLDNSSTLPNPTASSKTNSPSLSALCTTENDAIKALEAKVGTGTGSTPAANQILRGTGSGTSDWGQLSSSQWASVLTDETGTGFSVFNNTPTLITPKVDTINESTTDNGVTVDGLNIKDGALSGTGVITASNISASAITLGYAKLTTNYTSPSGNNWNQVTGTVNGVTSSSFGVTVTLPGTRNVMIETWARDVYGSSTGTIDIGIFDGAVTGTGTPLTYGEPNHPTAGGAAIANVKKLLIAPAAGSHTYNVALRPGGSYTASMDANSAYEAFIFVWAA